ncbi:hypothetical protein CASFOL_026423 [Castilleja foliolosa]|uniref:Polygalacturonase n=1 Tax=Castilleja foliolosa TaxID=1961234 RepID=A0ABD3CJR8_9LAMI
MKNTRFLVYVTFLFFILSSHFVRIDARKHKKHKDIAPSSETPNDDSGSANTFSVTKYGAAGNGITDDTDAFSKAWTAACNSENSVMLVPSGTYLVNQITFSGDSCKSRMIFQVEGKIVAPSIGEFKAVSSDLAWLDFTKVNGLTIMGVGDAIIYGTGEGWWKSNKDTKPTISKAIRVIGCDDVIVTGITIQDSQQAHLKFDNCNGVDAYGITISSPPDSANTDGIHLQGSQKVNLYEIKIACGDDCISMQTGSSGINITNVQCGPSHGISIGSLGKDGSKACVSDVTVTDSYIFKSDNGVRIKTWQGGLGSVKGVKFSNIKVDNVEIGVDINQHYCDGGDGCGGENSQAVAISDVTFDNIHGSFSLYSVNLVCSGNKPCEDITLSRINLTPLSTANLEPSCSNAYGPTDSTAHCLKKSGSSSSSSYYKSSDNDGGYGNTDTC